ncbi:MAG: PhnD/SsuA/transferrin family substrate-binding protein [Caldilineaceae bacterium]
MPTLNMTTCLAVNTVAFMQALPDYLQMELGLAAAFMPERAGWADHIAQVGAGHIQMAWLCGWPYVRMRDAHVDEQRSGDLEIVAAPVLQAPRYAGQPLYFADVVVSAAAAYDTMASLRGAAWAYNDPGSLSGWLSVTHFLASELNVAQGDPARFFGRIVESGGHAHSLNLLLRGQIDCAAIDSTLLDYLRQTEPMLDAQIRVLHTLGPFPIPPLVIHRRVDAAVRQRIRTVLLQMHQAPAGRRVLGAAALSHFVAGADADYDPVRRMSARVG